MFPRAQIVEVFLDQAGFDAVGFSQTLDLEEQALL